MVSLETNKNFLIFAILILNIVNMSNEIYKCNKNFFKDISTPEQAYVLGFIYSDGYIRMDIMMKDLLNSLKLSHKQILFIKLEIY